jgi:hypothetical protein
MYVSWRSHEIEAQLAISATDATFLLTCFTLSKIMRRMGKKKNLHAQALGSLGGSARAERLSTAKLSKIASKGGKARAKKLSAARLSEIARKAVAARERKRAEREKGNA